MALFAVRLCLLLLCATPIVAEETQLGCSGADPEGSCADEALLLQLKSQVSMAGEEGSDHSKDRLARLRAIKQELDGLEVQTGQQERVRALLREMSTLVNITQADAELKEVASAVRLFQDHHGPEGRQFRDCLQVLAAHREGNQFAGLTGADAEALQKSCEQFGDGSSSPKACAEFAEAAQVMTKFAPPAWVASTDAVCAFAVNFLMPAGEEPACMRVMNAVSLDFAKKQHSGSLQKISWPVLATEPSFPKSFHATCTRELPGLDCTTTATKLQALSRNLVQQAKVSSAIVRGYHRAACGAMQLLSKGTGLIEAKTRRAEVRRAFEEALAEDVLEEDKSEEHEEQSPPRLSRYDANELEDQVSGVIIRHLQRSVGAVRASLTPPLSAEKMRACRNNRGYIREVGGGIGAVASADGSIGMGYGVDAGGKTGSRALVQWSGYYTVCASMGLDAGADAGISEAEMTNYGNIAGFSMVLSTEACIGICLGGSAIWCLDNNLNNPTRCGTAYMAGAGAGINVGWSACRTRQLPPDMRRAGSERINCPSSWWR